MKVGFFSVFGSHIKTSC